MEKMPTAEEVIDKMVKFASVNDTINCTVYSLSQVMIEFAKLHVEAALKVKGKAMQEVSNEDSSFSIDELDAFTKNCYPLSNIK